MQRKQQSRIMPPQPGVVTSRSPDGYRVKVFLTLLQIETEWIRVGSSYVGAGWGLVALPQEGTEVAVSFLNGDLNDGYVSACFFSDEADRPPVEADAAPVLVHESGSVLRFSADGSVEFSPATELRLAGGGPAVARVGDKVSCPCGTGTIVSGSGKVNCGG